MAKPIERLRDACALCAFVIVSVFPSAASGQTAVRKMEYYDCLNVIRSSSASMGIAPVTIVKTNDLTVVRFVTSDGSVLMSCSRLDKKMILRISKRR